MIICWHIVNIYQIERPFKWNYSRQDQCEQCFKDAVKSVRRPRANNGKAAMKTALIGCSEEHLSSLYSDCTALAKQENSDKEQVFKCYIKVLVGNTVKQCTAGNINIYSRPSLITLTLFSE